MSRLSRLFSGTAALGKPQPIRDSIECTLPDGDVVQVLRVRDPRTRRLKLSVDERGARLSMPLRASLLAGDRFLREHAGWLALQLQQHAERAPDPLQPGITHELPLRGDVVLLRWTTGRIHRVHVDTDHALVFETPAKASEAAMCRALRDFYEAQARSDIGRWLPLHVHELPRPPSRVTFKTMSSQWGSLAPDGAMALDLSLVLARPAAFEYVLVHELCHLIHANHSPAFWHEVEQRCPHWRAERSYFNAHGRQLKASLRALTTPAAKQR